MGMAFLWGRVSATQASLGMVGGASVSLAKSVHTVWGVTRLWCALWGHILEVVACHSVLPALPTVALLRQAQSLLQCVNVFQDLFRSLRVGCATSVFLGGTARDTEKPCFLVSRGPFRRGLVCRTAWGVSLAGPGHTAWFLPPQAPQTARPVLLGRTSLDGGLAGYRIACRAGEELTVGCRGCQRALFARRGLCRRGWG